MILGMFSSKGNDARLPSTLEAIGHTPLVELHHIPDGQGRILAKLEFLNPGGSK